MAKSKGGIIKKIILLIIVCIGGVGGYWAYENIFKSNVHLDGKKFTYIFIKTDATFDDVLDELYSENIIDDHSSFEWMAKEMYLPGWICSGKFISLAIHSKLE